MLRNGHGHALGCVVVRSDVVGREVDVGERRTIVSSNADDTVGVEVAIELVALSTPTAEEEDESGENGQTCYAADSSTDDCSCIRA